MEDKLTCIKCQKELLELEQFIYLLFIVTDKQILYVYPEIVINYINKYLVKNPSHLSASELMILRTDIVANILKIDYPNLKYWGFTTLEVCNECYEIYKQAQPLL